MRRSWIVGTLLLTAMAAGCGEDSTDAGDSSAAVGEPRSGGGPDEAGETQTELPRFCDLLTSEQVATAVGAPVTLEAGPFDECEFDQEDPRALSGSLGAVPVDIGNGGFEAYRSGSNGTLDAAVDHPIAGVGDEAFVATGTFAGGENLQASGATLLGGTAYTVTLVQGAGLSEDELVAISEKLLTLLVEVA